jgi:hypothetical protein
MKLKDFAPVLSPSGWQPTAKGLATCAVNRLAPTIIQSVKHGAPTGIAPQASTYPGCTNTASERAVPVKSSLARKSSWKRLKVPQTRQVATMTW